MAEYVTTFTKPYPSGYQDLPSEATPVGHEIIESWETAIVSLESYLSENNIPEVSASIPQSQQTGVYIASITINGTQYKIYTPMVRYESSITEGTKVGTLTFGSYSFDVYAPTSSAGGSTVSVVPKTLTGTNIAEITVDGTAYQLYAPTGGGSGSTVTAESTLTEGTQIGKITIDGTETILYAPTSSPITVDSELSATSENAIQNKAVAEEFQKYANGTKVVAKATEANTATTASNAEKVNGHTVGADVPSNAVFTDTVYDDSTVKTSIQNIVNGTTQVGSATKATQDAQGNVIDTTYAKKTEIPQGTVIDDALSSTSTNPVQNKVVKAEFDKVNSNLDGLGYGENGAKNIFKDYDVMASYSRSSETYNGYPIIYSNKPWEGAYQSDLILKSGVTYTISAYVKGSGDVFCFASKDILLDATKALTDNFKRVSFTYKPTEDISKIRLENGTTGGLYIACFQIEEGTQATPYEPYIPSVKMLADENSQQSTEMMDIKMLGWSVPKECPIQNEVNGNQFTQNVNRIDMGEADWRNHSTDLWIFSIPKDANKPISIGYSPDFEIFNSSSFADTQEGKINLGHSVAVFYRNSQLSDVGAVKSFMNGKYLYYKVSNPITISVDGNEAVTNIEKVCMGNLWTLENSYSGSSGFIIPFTDFSLTVGKYKLEYDVTELSTIRSSEFGFAKTGASDKIKSISTTDALGHFEATFELTETCYKVFFFSNSSNIKITNLKLTLLELGSEVNKIKNDLSNLKDGTTPAAKAVADEDGNNIKSTYATLGEDAKFRSISCGGEAYAKSDGCSAFGYRAGAYGNYSQAQGEAVTAYGNYSHAEGESTNFPLLIDLNESDSISTILSKWENKEFSLAKGAGSHAEGFDTLALGDYSHSEGRRTIAYGNTSHAEGIGTKALNNQHALGAYNNSTTAEGQGTLGSGDGTALVIGNGTYESKSNAFRVNYNGEVFAKSATISTGADYAEYFEWEDGNPNNEDRRGYFVALNNNKIRLAEPKDYILGVISGFPSVIGNGDEEWMGRYVFDDFGAPVIEEFEYENPITGETKIGTKWKENPDYDNTRPYIQRSKRQEWDAVGMLGVLSVRDDGTCVPNKYCKITDGSIATLSEDKSDYRVLERVNDNVVKIVFR